MKAWGANQSTWNFYSIIYLLNYCFQAEVMGFFLERMLVERVNSADQINLMVTYSADCTCHPCFQKIMFNELTQAKLPWWYHVLIVLMIRFVTQWRTIYEISIGGVGECQGPRKILCRSHRRIRGHARTGKFESYNLWNAVSNILGTEFYRIPKYPTTRI